VVVCGLVGGEDLAEFGEGGDAGEVLLVCEAVFLEGEFDRGDGKGVVSGVCGGCAKEATHSADGIILCNLEVLENALG